MVNPESKEAAEEIAKHLGIIQDENALYDDVANGSRILSEDELSVLVDDKS